jgi:tetratricopeptide (TPR) repeat protein
MTRPLSVGLAGLLALALLATAARAETRYALLVGVQKYEKVGLRNLDFPENDVTVLARVLKGHGYRVVLMTRTRGAFDARYMPRSANIRGELRKMLKGCTRADTVLVVFCGHGVQFDRRDEPYFCPMDTDVANRRTLVSLGEVYDELKKSQAGAKLLIADACRNDPLPKGGKGAQVEAKLLSPTVAGHNPPENVVALFSCSTGETALESPDLRHGVFFYHLIQALRGKGLAADTKDVTLLALTDYLQRQVPRYVKSQFDEEQNPELFGRSSRPIVLLTLGRRAPVNKAPPQPGQNAWGLVESGLSFMQERKYDRAVAVLTEALKKNPRAAPASAMRADARLALGDPDKALADANRAVELDPKSEIVYRIRADVLSARRDAEKAIADYTRAIQLSPRYHLAFNNRGVAHAARGDTAKALADYAEALRLNPRYSEALNNRGNAHAAAKDYDRAIADYTRALRFSPRLTEAYHNRGLARFRKRDLDRAIDDFTAAIRHARRGENGLTARAYGDRGSAYFNKKNYRQAIDDFTQAIKLAPRTAVYYRHRALAYAHTGDKARAERDREKARQLSTP